MSTDFTVEISQNEYLAEGAEDVNAIVTVIPRTRGSRRPWTTRAARRSSSSTAPGTSKLLAKVVDVVDAASGTVPLKKRVDDADEMALDTRSTKTVRTKK